MIKKILRIELAVLIITVIASCNTEPKQVEISTIKTEKTDIVAENKEEVDMKVEGMVCAMGCAKYIEDKVAGLEGIVFSQVNFEKGTAHFEFDQNTLSSQEIEKFINQIHDGQYKAKITDGNSMQENQELDEEESDDEEQESIVSVSESVNITFPELFTYFLRHLR